MNLFKPIPLSKAAIEDLFALEQAAFSDPWSKESLAHALSDPLCRSAGVYLAGKWAAYGLMQVVAGEGEILRIAVSPEQRRKGFGEAVLQALLAEEGLSAVYLEVRSENRPAIALYEKAGFALCGRRPRYYQNPVDDAILMRLDIC